MSQRIKVYDSQSRAYHQAFQVFLDHTDQKLRAKQWLDRLVKTLPCQRNFIDVGAGTGKVTSWFINSFSHTIAIEPNESLRAELKKNCPQIEVRAEKIMDTDIAVSGDFVLCSHVFYYIERAEWMANLDRLASLVSREGVLVVVVQHHDSDCMHMLQHFFGWRFNLGALRRNFQAEKGDRYEIAIETVPAYVTTSDLSTAYIIAEFMLNLLPMPAPPTQNELEEYVRRYFASPEGGFLFSCDQDFLQIRPR